MRAGASRASASATPLSTMPPPTAMVSAACAPALSPSATAAAMPPCAQALEAPWPSGAAEMSVTGRGARFSAQNNPARPPPTMTTSSVRRVRSYTLSDMAVLAIRRSHASGFSIDSRCRRSDGSVLQVDHPLDRTPRLVRDHGVDGDFLPQVDQAVQNLRQRDPLHVRAEIARAHHLDVGQFSLHVVGHRAFGDHHHALALVLAYPVDHVRGRAGEIGFRQHVGRAFRMRDDLHGGVRFTISAQLVAGESLMDLTGALPGDDLH